MNLVAFVVSGQHMHDQVDAKAIRVFPLPLAPGYDGKLIIAVAIDRPGGRPIVWPDDNAGNAVAGRGGVGLHPNGTAGVAPGKLLNQVESLGQDVLLRYRLQRQNAHTVQYCPKVLTFR